MQTIPADILEQFSAVLEKRTVPVSCYSDYRKWLRYYLDFRSKYPLPASRSEHVRLFIQKLREKKQTTEQQKQAAHALSLYFEMLRKIDNKTPPAQINTENAVKATSPSTPSPINTFGDRFIKGESSVPPPSAGRRFNEWRCLEKTISPAWDKIIGNLAAEIKMRRYSRKTLKTYADWSRKFQGYLKNKPPDALTAADVKAYLKKIRDTEPV